MWKCCSTRAERYDIIGEHNELLDRLWQKNVATADVTFSDSENRAQIICSVVNLMWRK